MGALEDLQAAIGSGFTTTIQTIQRAVEPVTTTVGSFFTPAVNYEPVQPAQQYIESSAGVESYNIPDAPDVQYRHVDTVPIQEQRIPAISDISDYGGSAVRYLESLITPQMPDDRFGAGSQEMLAREGSGAGGRGAIDAFDAVSPMVVDALVGVAQGFAYTAPLTTPAGIGALAIPFLPKPDFDKYTYTPLGPEPSVAPGASADEVVQAALAVPEYKREFLPELKDPIGTALGWLGGIPGVTDMFGDLVTAPTADAYRTQRQLDIVAQAETPFTKESSELEALANKYQSGELQAFRLAPEVGPWQSQYDAATTKYDRIYQEGVSKGWLKDGAFQVPDTVEGSAWASKYESARVGVQEAQALGHQYISKVGDQWKIKDEYILPTDQYSAFLNRIGGLEKTAKMYEGVREQIYKEGVSSGVLEEVKQYGVPFEGTWAQPVGQALSALGFRGEYKGPGYQFTQEAFQTGFEEYDIAYGKTLKATPQEYLPWGGGGGGGILGPSPSATLPTVNIPYVTSFVGGGLERIQERPLQFGATLAAGILGGAVLRGVTASGALVGLTPEFMETAPWVVRALPGVIGAEMLGIYSIETAKRSTGYGRTELYTPEESARRMGGITAGEMIPFFYGMGWGFSGRMPAHDEPLFAGIRERMENRRALDAELRRWDEFDPFRVTKPLTERYRETFGEGIPGSGRQELPPGQEGIPPWEPRQDNLPWEPRPLLPSGSESLAEPFPFDRPMGKPTDVGPFGDTPRSIIFSDVSYRTIDDYPTWPVEEVSTIRWYPERSQMSLAERTELELVRQQTAELDTHGYFDRVLGSRFIPEASTIVAFDMFHEPLAATQYTLEEGPSRVSVQRFGGISEEAYPVLLSELQGEAWISRRPYVTFEGVSDIFGTGRLRAEYPEGREANAAFEPWWGPTTGFSTISVFGVEGKGGTKSPFSSGYLQRAEDIMRKDISDTNLGFARMQDVDFDPYVVTRMNLIGGAIKDIGGSGYGGVTTTIRGKISGAVSYDDMGNRVEISRIGSRLGGYGIGATLLNQVFGKAAISPRIKGVTAWSLDKAIPFYKQAGFYEISPKHPRGLAYKLTPETRISAIQRATRDIEVWTGKAVSLTTPSDYAKFLWASEKRTSVTQEEIDFVQYLDATTSVNAPFGDTPRQIYDESWFDQTYSAQKGKEYREMLVRPEQLEEVEGLTVDPWSAAKSLNELVFSKVMGTRPDLRAPGFDYKTYFGSQYTEYELPTGEKLYFPTQKRLAREITYAAHKTGLTPEQVSSIVFGEETTRIAAAERPIGSYGEPASMIKYEDFVDSKTGVRISIPYEEPVTIGPGARGIRPVAYAAKGGTTKIAYEEYVYGQPMKVSEGLPEMIPRHVRSPITGLTTEYSLYGEIPRIISGTTRTGQRIARLTTEEAQLFLKPEEYSALSLPPGSVEEAWTWGPGGNLLRPISEVREVGRVQKTYQNLPVGFTHTHVHPTALSGVIHGEILSGEDIKVFASQSKMLSSRVVSPGRQRIFSATYTGELGSTVERSSLVEVSDVVYTLNAHRVMEGLAKQYGVEKEQVTSVVPQQTMFDIMYSSSLKTLSDLRSVGFPIEMHSFTIRDAPEMPYEPSIVRNIKYGTFTADDVEKVSEQFGIGKARANAVLRMYGTEIPFTLYDDTPRSISFRHVNRVLADNFESSGITGHGTHDITKLHHQERRASILNRRSLSGDAVAKLRMFGEEKLAGQVLLRQLRRDAAFSRAFNHFTLEQHVNRYHRYPDWFEVFETGEQTVDVRRDDRMFGEINRMHDAFLGIGRMEIENIIGVPSEETLRAQARRRIDTTHQRLQQKAWAVSGGESLFFEEIVKENAFQHFGDMEVDYITGLSYNYPIRDYPYGLPLEFARIMAARAETTRIVRAAPSEYSPEGHRVRTTDIYSEREGIFDADAAQWSFRRFGQWERHYGKRSLGVAQPIEYAENIGELFDRHIYVGLDARTASSVPSPETRLEMLYRQINVRQWRQTLGLSVSSDVYGDAEYEWKFGKYRNRQEYAIGDPYAKVFRQWGEWETGFAKPRRAAGASTGELAIAVESIGRSGSFLTARSTGRSVKFVGAGVHQWSPKKSVVEWYPGGDYFTPYEEERVLAFLEAAKVVPFEMSTGRGYAHDALELISKGSSGLISVSPEGIPQGALAFTIGSMSRFVDYTPEDYMYVDVLGTRGMKLGAGRQLMEAAIGEAAYRNLGAVSLYSVHDAILFYEKMGLKQIEPDRAYMECIGTLGEYDSWEQVIGATRQDMHIEIRDRHWATSKYPVFSIEEYQYGENVRTELDEYRLSTIEHDLWREERDWWRMPISDKTERMRSGILLMLDAVKEIQRGYGGRIAYMHDTPVSAISYTELVPGARSLLIQHFGSRIPEMGFGSKLISGVISKSLEYDIKSVRLVPLSDAVPFYRGLGFKAEGVSTFNIDFQRDLYREPSPQVEYTVMSGEAYADVFMPEDIDKRLVGTIHEYGDTPRNIEFVDTETKMWVEPYGRSRAEYERIARDVLSPTTPQIPAFLTDKTLKLAIEENVRYGADWEAVGESWSPGSWFTGLTWQGAEGPLVGWMGQDILTGLHEIGHSLLGYSHWDETKQQWVGSQIPSEYRKLLGKGGYYAATGTLYENIPGGYGAFELTLTESAKREFQRREIRLPYVTTQRGMGEVSADLFRAYHYPTQSIMLRETTPHTYEALKRLYGPSQFDISMAEATREVFRDVARHGFTDLPDMAARHGISVSDLLNIENLMIPDKRWQHGGIAKSFAKRVDRITEILGAEPQEPGEYTPLSWDIYGVYGDAPRNIEIGDVDYWRIHGVSKPGYERVRVKPGEESKYLYPEEFRVISDVYGSLFHRAEQGWLFDVETKEALPIKTAYRGAHKATFETKSILDAAADAGGPVAFSHTHPITRRFTRPVIFSDTDFLSAATLIERGADIVQERVVSHGTVFSFEFKPRGVLEAGVDELPSFSPREQASLMSTVISGERERGLGTIGVTHSLANAARTVGATLKQYDLWHLREDIVYDISKSAPFKWESMLPSHTRWRLEWMPPEKYARAAAETRNVMGGYRLGLHGWMKPSEYATGVSAPRPLVYIKSAGKPPIYILEDAEFAAKLFRDTYEKVPVYAAHVNAEFYKYYEKDIIKGTAKGEFGDVSRQVEIDTTTPKSPLLETQYGGLPSGGGYSSQTEYEIGHQRYAEAAHCIIGSLHKIEFGGRDEMSIALEAGHIASEAVIMAESVAEYSKGLYNRQLVNYYKDIESRAYVEKTVESIHRQSPLLRQIARNKGIELYRFKGLRPDLDITEADPFGLINSLAGASYSSVEVLAKNAPGLTIETLGTFNVFREPEVKSATLAIELLTRKYVSYYGSEHLQKYLSEKFREYDYHRYGDVPRNIGVDVRRREGVSIIDTGLKLPGGQKVTYEQVVVEPGKELQYVYPEELEALQNPIENLYGYLTPENMWVWDASGNRLPLEIERKRKSVIPVGLQDLALYVRDRGIGPVVVGHTHPVDANTLGFHPFSKTDLHVPYGWQSKGVPVREMRVVSIGGVSSVKFGRGYQDKLSAYSYMMADVDLLSAGKISKSWDNVSFEEREYIHNIVAYAAARQGDKYTFYKFPQFEEIGDATTASISKLFGGRTYGDVSREVVLKSPGVRWETEKTGYPEFDSYINALKRPEHISDRYHAKEHAVFSWMTPDQYIGEQIKIFEGRAARSRDEILPGSLLFKFGLRQEAVEELKLKLLDEKNVFKSLVIEYDESGKILDFQEGRHRAVAAKELGIEHLPVWSFYKKDYVPISDTSYTGGGRSQYGFELGEELLSLQTRRAKHWVTEVALYGDSPRAIEFVDVPRGKELEYAHPIELELMKKQAMYPGQVSEHGWTLSKSGELIRFVRGGLHSVEMTSPLLLPKAGVYEGHMHPYPYTGVGSFSNRDIEMFSFGSRSRRIPVLGERLLEGFEITHVEFLQHPSTSFTRRIQKRYPHARTHEAGREFDDVSSRLTDIIFHGKRAEARSVIRTLSEKSGVGFKEFADIDAAYAILGHRVMSQTHGRVVSAGLQAAADRGLIDVTYYRFQIPELTPFENSLSEFRMGAVETINRILPNVYEEGQIDELNFYKGMRRDYFGDVPRATEINFMGMKVVTVEKGEALKYAYPEEVDVLRDPYRHLYGIPENLWAWRAESGEPLHLGLTRRSGSVRVHTPSLKKTVARAGPVVWSHTHPIQPKYSGPLPFSIPDISVTEHWASNYGIKPVEERVVTQGAIYSLKYPEGKSIHEVTSTLLQHYRVNIFARQGPITIGDAYSREMMLASGAQASGATFTKYVFPEYAKDAIWDISTGYKTPTRKSLAPVTLYTRRSEFLGKLWWTEDKILPVDERTMYSERGKVPFRFFSQEYVGRRAFDFMSPQEYLAAGGIEPVGISPSEKVRSSFELGYVQKPLWMDIREGGTTLYHQKKAQEMLSLGLKEVGVIKVYPEELVLSRGWAGSEDQQVYGKSLVKALGPRTRQRRLSAYTDIYGDAPRAIEFKEREDVEKVYRVITETDFEHADIFASQGIIPSFKPEIPEVREFAPGRGLDREGTYVADAAGAFSPGSFGRVRIHLELKESNLGISKELKGLGYSEKDIVYALSGEMGAVTLGTIERDAIKEIEVYDYDDSRWVKFSPENYRVLRNIQDIPLLPTTEEFEKILKTKAVDLFLSEIKVAETVTTYRNAPLRDKAFFARELGYEDVPRVIQTQQELNIYIKEEDLETYRTWGGEAHTTLKSEPGVLVKGVIFDRSVIPEKLYHVTTNLPAVIESGVLRHIERGAGLGKGSGITHRGVSLTTSLPDAFLMERELLRLGELSRGKPFEIALGEWAKVDEELTGASAQRAVRAAMDDYRFHVKHEVEDELGLRNTAVQDAHTYRMIREQDKGFQDPIIFGDATKFVDISPETVGIVVVDKSAIPDAAVVRDPIEGFMHEIMVHADVPVRGDYRKLRFEELNLYEDVPRTIGWDIIEPMKVVVPPSSRDTRVYEYNKIVVGPELESRFAFEEELEILRNPKKYLYGANEQYFAWDTTGKRISVDYTGNATYLEIHDAYALARDIVKHGGVFTDSHTHPNLLPFSAGDFRTIDQMTKLIKSAIDWEGRTPSYFGFAESRVVTFGKIFSLRSSIEPTISTGQAENMYAGYRSEMSGNALYQAYSNEYPTGYDARSRIISKITGQTNVIFTEIEFSQYKPEPFWVYPSHQSRARQPVEWMSIDAAIDALSIGLSSGVQRMVEGRSGAGVHSLKQYIDVQGASVLRIGSDKEQISQLNLAHQYKALGYSEVPVENLFGDAPRAIEFKEINDYKTVVKMANATTGGIYREYPYQSTIVGKRAETLFATKDEIDILRYPKERLYGKDEVFLAWGGSGSRLVVDYTSSRNVIDVELDMYVENILASGGYVIEAHTHPNYPVPFSSGDIGFMTRVTQQATELAGHGVYLEARAVTYGKIFSLESMQGDAMSLSSLAGMTEKYVHLTSDQLVQSELLDTYPQGYNIRMAALARSASESGLVLKEYVFPHYAPKPFWNIPPYESLSWMKTEEFIEKMEGVVSSDTILGPSSQYEKKLLKRKINITGADALYLGQSSYQATQLKLAYDYKVLGYSEVPVVVEPSYSFGDQPRMSEMEEYIKKSREMSRFLQKAREEYLAEERKKRAEAKVSIGRRAHEQLKYKLWPYGFSDEAALNEDLGVKHAAGIIAGFIGKRAEQEILPEGFVVGLPSKYTVGNLYDDYETLVPNIVSVVQTYAGLPEFGKSALNKELRAVYFSNMGLLSQIVGSRGSMEPHGVHATFGIDDPFNLRAVVIDIATENTWDYPMLYRHEMWHEALLREEEASPRFKERLEEFDVISARARFEALNIPEKIATHRRATESLIPFLEATTREGVLSSQRYSSLDKQRSRIFGEGYQKQPIYDVSGKPWDKETYEYVGEFVGDLFGIEPLRVSYGDMPRATSVEGKEEPVEKPEESTALIRIEPELAFYGKPKEVVYVFPDLSVGGAPVPVYWHEPGEGYGKYTFVGLVPPDRGVQELAKVFGLVDKESGIIAERAIKTDWKILPPPVPRDRGSWTEIRDDGSVIIHSENPMKPRSVQLTISLGGVQKKPKMKTQPVMVAPVSPVISSRGGSGVIAILKPTEGQERSYAEMLSRAFMSGAGRSKESAKAKEMQKERDEFGLTQEERRIAYLHDFGVCGKGKKITEIYPWMKVVLSTRPLTKEERGALMYGVVPPSVIETARGRLIAAANLGISIPRNTLETLRIPEEQVVNRGQGIIKAAPIRAVGREMAEFSRSVYTPGAKTTPVNLQKTIPVVGMTPFVGQVPDVKMRSVLVPARTPGQVVVPVEKLTPTRVIPSTKVTPGITPPVTPVSFAPLVPPVVPPVAATPWAPPGGSSPRGGGYRSYYGFGEKLALIPSMEMLMGSRGKRSPRRKPRYRGTLRTGKLRDMVGR